MEYIYSTYTHTFYSQFSLVKAYTHSAQCVCIQYNVSCNARTSMKSHTLGFIIQVHGHFQHSPIIVLCLCQLISNCSLFLRLNRKQPLNDTNIFFFLVSLQFHKSPSSAHTCVLYYFLTYSILSHLRCLVCNCILPRVRVQMDHNLYPSCKFII